MKTLYLDMDGVVADWDSAATRLIGQQRRASDGRWSQEDWLRIRANPHFYRDLPLMPRADQLVALAREFRAGGWDLHFLTAIPRDNDHPWAFWDKIMWAQQHFPDIAVFFGPYSEDKQAHTRPGDILVDDRSQNIREWQARGGRGILVENGDLTGAIEELRHCLGD